MQLSVPRMLLIRLRDCGWSRTALLPHFSPFQNEPSPGGGGGGNKFALFWGNCKLTRRKREQGTAQEKEKPTQRWHRDWLPRVCVFKTPAGPVRSLEAFVVVPPSVPQETALTIAQAPERGPDVSLPQCPTICIDAELLPMSAAANTPHPRVWD